MSAGASETQAAVSSGPNDVSFFSACGAVSSAPTGLPSFLRISTGTRPATSSNWKRGGGRLASVASTKAVPTFGCNGLHLRRRKAAGVEHHRERIATEGAIGKNIDSDIAPLHLISPLSIPTAIPASAGHIP